MKDEIQVADILKSYISEKCINVSKLARSAGVSYNVLYNVLKDRTTLKADDFIKICNALEMTGDELLTYPLHNSEAVDK